MAIQDDSLLNDDNLPLQNEEIIKVENEFSKCKNCGFEPIDHYCLKCGQRTQKRFSVRYIIEELFSVFEFEKGFLKNIVELTLRPAKMIEEYLNGKTKDFYSPFSYFLVSMTVFLFIVFSFPTTSTEKINQKEALIFNSQQEEAKIKKKYAEKIAILSSQIKNTDSLRWLSYLVQNDLPKETLSFSTFRDTEKYLKKDSSKVVEKYFEQELIQNKEQSLDFYFTYLTISHQLIELQELQEREFKNIEKQSLLGKIATYTLFYFTPLYLACLVVLFYRKQKLYFSEHLIIQTFITTQIIIYITFLVAIFRLWYWISYNFDKNSVFIKTNPLDTTLGTLLSLLGFIIIVFYYFYVSYRFYKQSIWLTLLKCILIGFLLTLIAFLFFLLVTVLVSIK